MEVDCSCGGDEIEDDISCVGVMVVVVVLAAVF